MPRGQRRTKAQQQAHDRELWRLHTDKGMTYQAIADAVSEPLSTVATCVQRVARMESAELSQKTGEYRARHAAIIDQTISQLVTLCEENSRSDEPNYAAYDRLMRVLERQAKLLGLDMPVQIQVDHTTTTTWDEELAALNAELQLNDPTISALAEDARA